MRKDQAQTIISLSKQLEVFNFDELIKILFIDPVNFEAVTLGQSETPLSDFIFLAKNIARKFQDEFQKETHYIVYPISYSNLMYGQSTVETQLTRLLELLDQKNINSLNTADNFLQWLVGYQVHHGFYFKRQTRSEEITTDSLKKLSEKLNVIEISIETKLSQTNELNLELNNQIKKIQNLIEQKREELNQLTVNLSTSNTQTNQISELLNKSTEQSSRINTLLEQQEQNKQQNESTLNDIKEIYKSTLRNLTEEETKLNEVIKEFLRQKDLFTEHLNFVEEKRNFFEERNNYLNTLIGREVGASLFETFKQRKIELQGPIQFWQWLVPAMTILTILWIFFLFSNNVDTSDYHLWWQAFALNTLKTIPAIFLLAFTINQYRKERNFQEEYAFKSAVALTIDAYAGRLTDPINRDKLIMDAVLNIYKTPIQEKFSDNVKSQTAIETLKSFIDTTKDIVKNNK